MVSTPRPSTSTTTTPVPSTTTKTSSPSTTTTTTTNNKSAKCFFHNITGHVPLDAPPKGRYTRKLVIKLGTFLVKVLVTSSCDGRALDYRLFAKRKEPQRVGNEKKKLETRTRYPTLQTHGSKLPNPGFERTSYPPQSYKRQQIKHEREGLYGDTSEPYFSIRQILTVGVKQYTGPSHTKEASLPPSRYSAA